jgi:hypothetical protein
MVIVGFVLVSAVANIVHVGGDHAGAMRRGSGARDREQVSGQLALVRLELVRHHAITLDDAYRSLLAFLSY